MSRKIAIVGGGPAGIFCAIRLLDLEPKIQITIFEKDSILKTLLPTGGGRCNLSYNENNIKDFATNYPRGEKFLYSVLNNFNINEKIKYFKKIGIETYTQKDNRIFPISNSSKDVKEKLLNKIRNKVKIIKKEIKKTSELEEFDKVIIATGGHSGYKIAEEIGHNIVETTPSLHGYITNEKYPAGVSVKINNDNILFTHDGVSGPYIYKHSSIHAYDKYPRKILVQIINKEILKQIIKDNPKKSFGNIVSTLIPKSLAKVIVKNFDKQCAQVTNKEIEEIIYLNFTATSADKKGEIVTAGGVNLKEIDKNCKSKINKKYYFIGEVLDIDGYTGGFNLQNCWSTASSVALDITK